MQKLAVFGHPISHSRSPRIHTLFAQQTGQSLSYEAILAPLDSFEMQLQRFFNEGGNGANITTPFKERACLIAQQLTERAALAGAVNTLHHCKDGTLLGENTDGIGLLSDLQRLSMIKPGDRVLIVGAGGAARGVIYPLLEQQCEVVVTNRTFSRAQQLVEFFSGHLSEPALSACQLSDLSNESFQLVINATSSGLQNDVPCLPDTLIHKETRCYDMFYSAKLTPFLKLAQGYGAEYLADGLGMLVGQAAHSFALWCGVMPEITPVMELLRQEMDTQV